MFRLNLRSTDIPSKNQKRRAANPRRRKRRRPPTFSPQFKPLEKRLMLSGFFGWGGDGESGGVLSSIGGAFSSVGGSLVAQGASIGKGIVDGMGAAGDAVGEVVEDLAEDTEILTDYVTQEVTETVEDLAEDTKILTDYVTQEVTETVEDLAEDAKTVVDYVVENPDEVLETTKKETLKTIDKALEDAETMGTYITDELEQAAEDIAEDVTITWDYVRENPGEAWDTTLDSLENTAGDAWDATADASIYVYDKFEDGTVANYLAAGADTAVRFVPINQMLPEEYQLRVGPWFGNQDAYYQVTGAVDTFVEDAQEDVQILWDYASNDPLRAVRETGGAVRDTFVEGKAADGLAGGIDGFTQTILPLPEGSIPQIGPIYDNQDAYDNSKVVGVTQAIAFSLIIGNAAGSGNVAAQVFVRLETGAGLLTVASNAAQGQSHWSDGLLLLPAATELATASGASRVAREANHLDEVQSAQRAVGSTAGDTGTVQRSQPRQKPADANPTAKAKPKASTNGAQPATATRSQSLARLTDNAEQLGLPRDQMRRLIEASQENDWVIIVRKGNPESVPYYGKPGHAPKPVDVKAKTAKSISNADGSVVVKNDAGGLVVDPTHPTQQKFWDDAEQAFRNDPEMLKKVQADRQKAMDSWNKFQQDHTDTLIREGGESVVWKNGMSVDPTDGTVRMNGDKLHGDIDVHGVYDRQTGELVDLGPGIRHDLEITQGEIRDDFVPEPEAAVQRRNDLAEKVNPNAPQGKRSIGHGAQANNEPGFFERWMKPDPDSFAITPDLQVEDFDGNLDNMIEFFDQNGLNPPEHYGNSGFRVPSQG